VQIVLLATRPLKIFGAIVGLVAIDVIDLLLAVWIWKKCLSDKAVDTVADFPAIDAECADVVAVPIYIGLQDAGIGHHHTEAAEATRL
jgi:hypothetical protein